MKKLSLNSEQTPRSLALNLGIGMADVLIRLQIDCQATVTGLDAPLQRADVERVCEDLGYSVKWLDVSE